MRPAHLTAVLGLALVLALPWLAVTGFALGSLFDGNAWQALAQQPQLPSALAHHAWTLVPSTALIG